jgi:hypothetical protein
MKDNKARHGAKEHKRPLREVYYLIIRHEPAAFCRDSATVNN